jgi:hypothetical protein
VHLPMNVTYSAAAAAAAVMRVRGHELCSETRYQRCCYAVALPSFVYASQEYLALFEQEPDDFSALLLTEKELQGRQQVCVRSW